MRRYVIIPGLINTLLFSLLIWYGASQFNSLIDWLLPAWLEWLRWLLWPLFGLAAALATFFTFTLVANLVGAPFNGLLAEAVERYLRGAVGEPAGGARRAVAAIGPALLSEMRKLVYFAIRAIPLLLLFLIPVANLAAPFLWMAFTAWMLAVEYADYPMGNHDLLFPRQLALLRSVLPLALGFGGATALLMMIPLLNFLAMPAAVAGATAMWVERLEPLTAGGTPRMDA